MLEKNGKWWGASCDSCSHSEEIEEYSFQDAIDRLKDLGWIITKKLGKWFHKCPSCQVGAVDDYDDVS